MPVTSTSPSVNQEGRRASRRAGRSNDGPPTTDAASLVRAESLAPRRVDVCGVPVDAVTLNEACDQIAEAIDARRSVQISVVNVAKLVNMRRDAMLRESVLSGDMILADGAPVVWLSRWKGTPLPERVAGIDLMFGLLKRAQEKSWRVYLLGAKEDVLENVVATIERDYPGAIVAGHRHGYFCEADEEGIANGVRDARADILFVAMSSPKKEIFMKRWGGVMAVPVVHGVGGSFDVMAGFTRRAPRWMQRVGLEWFYRMMQEPRRMARRYLVTNAVFLGICVAEVCRGRWGRGGKATA